jgi:hypothetical protein
MLTRSLVLSSLLLVSQEVRSVPTAAKHAKKAQPDGIPLSLVIAQVQDALNEYQNNLGAGESALPPLSSAEFDFKTITDVTVGGSVSLLIFKFGVTHLHETVNDVTYTYAVAPPKSVTGERVAPPTLKDQLAKAIQGAAKGVQGAATAAGMPFSRLAVTIQYGVKWDLNGAGQSAISFVTVGLNADRSQNTVQSVKLTFGK